MGRFYVMDAIGGAEYNYHPVPYPGPMKIFRSPKIYPGPHLGWTGLVKGGIETFDVPGEHEYRRVIMYEPFIGYVAKEVERDLANKSQAAAKVILH